MSLSRTNITSSDTGGSDMSPPHSNSSEKMGFGRRQSLSGRDLTPSEFLAMNSDSDYLPQFLSVWLEIERVLTTYIGSTN